MAITGNHHCSNKASISKSIKLTMATYANACILEYESQLRLATLLGTKCSTSLHLVAFRPPLRVCCCDPFVCSFAYRRLNANLGIRRDLSSTTLYAPTHPAALAYCLNKYSMRENPENLYKSYVHLRRTHTHTHSTDVHHVITELRNCKRKFYLLLFLFRWTFLLVSYYVCVREWSFALGCNCSQ